MCCQSPFNLFWYWKLEWWACLCPSRWLGCHGILHIEMVFWNLLQWHLSVFGHHCSMASVFMPALAVSVTGAMAIVSGGPVIIVRLVGGIFEWWLGSAPECDVEGMLVEWGCISNVHDKAIGVTYGVPFLMCCHGVRSPALAWFHSLRTWYAWVRKGAIVAVLAMTCCLYLIFKVLVRIVLDKTRDRPVALALRLPQ